MMGRLMQPLRITAVLESGQIIAPSGNIHLDGILGYAWICRHNPNRESGVTELIDPRLPLRKHVPEHDSTAWHWAVSAAHFEPVSEFVAHIHKRFRNEYEQYLDLESGSGRINASSGKYKADRVPFRVLLVDRIEWYAHGNRRGIRSLLKMVDWIGKKRAHGRGRVAEWIVEPWPHDWSLYGPDGEPTRAIPVPEEQAEDWQGVRHPHWHIARRRPVILPRSTKPIRLEAAS